MKVLPALIRKHIWESTLGFIFMWFSLMLGVIPISVAQGHRFVPESWFMTVEKLEVTSGFTHSVYFIRKVNHPFIASWKVEVEHENGKEVCSGSSIIGKPDLYSKEENPIKVWSLDFAVGDSCKLETEGLHRAIFCWFIDFGIWNKPICRTSEFYHYNMKRTNNE